MPTSTLKALTVIAGSGRVSVRRMFKALTALAKAHATNGVGRAGDAPAQRPTVAEAIYGLRPHPERPFRPSRVLDKLPAKAE